LQVNSRENTYQRRGDNFRQTEVNVEYVDKENIDADESRRYKSRSPYAG